MTKQKNNLLAIALLICCVIAGTWGIIRQNNLKNSYLFGVAKVYNYSSGGRGNAGGVWIDYILSINGKSYKGSSQYSTDDITSEVLNHCLNKTFPVIYKPTDPSISSLMLLPSDFRNKGYSFPDSLNWILTYVKD